MREQKYALLSLCLLAALPLGAASTGTTALHTPQGSGAGTANGDFVTASAGGLNTVYRYYIEVPSGLSRLVVDLFDADFGGGGGGEAAAQRDRERTAYNSSVTYSLLDPSGTARTTRFTTGNTASPTGADNAWLTFFDVTPNTNTVRDNFGTAAYTNNDGNNNWAAAWIESDGGGGGATGGAVFITGGQLRIGDNVTGTPNIQREADLLGTPGLNLSSAVLTFDFTTSGNLEGDDTISVEVSSNGGGAWTTLETFADDGTGSRSYDITAFIANNTRVRFVIVTGYNGNGGSEAFLVDNLEINNGGALTAGHWELRVDSSSLVTGGDDINALGVRVHDGNSGSGGTELNVYYDSHTQLGVNPPASGSTSRSYTLYPYLTSGCTASENDHDYDSNSGTVGSVAVTSRGGGFSQTFNSASLSGNNVWARNTITGWTTDSDATGYGIWTSAVGISNYTVGGTVNGNYANLYFANFQAAANPPGANPTTNTFRVYLPTDDGTAPAKPYLEQLARFTGCGGGNNGPNPPDTGQTSCLTVTVRVVNPAAQSVTFSTPSNIVTSNIPGSGAVYGGGAQVSQGSIVSQPSVGGTGDITWNPGTLAAGGTALLSYRVNVTPTSNGQRIPLTATPASGNGTRAQLVDETGNTTQARATYLLGPVCELAVTEDVPTEAVVASFVLRESSGRGVELLWTTASEVGTAGFYVERWDPQGKRFERVHRDLLAGLLHETQGGTYRFADESASPYEPQVYRLVEMTADGRRKVHGPYARRVEIGGPASSLETEYERTAHPARKAAPAAGLLKAKARPAPHGVHLSVEETGLYYLSAAEIADWLGIEEKQAEKKIAEGKVSLTQGGQPVAYRPDAVTADKREKRALGLFFYGEALDSLYSKANVYRLEKDKGGLLMSALTVPGASGAAGGTFGATLHAEQDAFPATAIAPDPESDYWFWEFVQGGDPTFGVRTFLLDAPGVDTGGAATLAVALHGATATGVDGEHQVEVRLNGTLLGDTAWQGIAAHQASFAVPPGVLTTSGNQVEVTGLVGPGAPFSIVYVASFDLSYVRAFQAAGDELAFTVTGGLPVGVEGFASSAVYLLDVAVPRRPRWIEGGLLEPDGGGGNRLGFVPPGPLKLFAAGGSALGAPAAVRPWTEAAVRSVHSGGEYLVITPPALRDAAERFAAFRAAGGLSTAVVDTDQIYDELAFGIPTPHALRSFVAGALAGWRTKPRLLVLAGKGTLDYRNLLGFGDNVLPPLMVQAPQGLFPSDNRLADANGDGMPELAVGRIPVLTGAELDAYRFKIAAYEASGQPAWGKQAMLLADFDDGAASFAADSDRVGAAFDSTFALDRVHLPSLPLAAARGQLFAAFAQGRTFINYLGHGGLDRLSGSGLLTSADVPGLVNAERLPVLTAMTCTVNRFAVPGVPALGELLVKSPTGGTAAVWGPTGLSDNAQARLLAERFYRQSSGQEAVLGNRILASLRAFRDLGGDITLINIYNLLGDPGLRIRSGPEPVPSGGSPGE